MEKNPLESIFGPAYSVEGKATLPKTPAETLVGADPVALHVYKREDDAELVAVIPLAKPAVRRKKRGGRSWSPEQRREASEKARQQWKARKGGA